MESSEKNKTETTASSFSKDSSGVKVNQKKKYFACCSVGCGILIILAIVFIVWLFVSPDSPDLDSKDTTPTPVAVSTQSTTKTEPPASPSPKTTAPPKVTTDCDGNFYPKSSGALGLNTNNPGLKQNINTHYYRVYGNTTQDILAGIKKCGPTENGNRYAAFTRHKINWVFATSPASLGCRVKNAAVGIQLDLYYPKWKPTKDAEAGLDDKWQAYYDHVVWHENVHKKDALNTAKDILNYLNSLSNVPCELINSGAQTHLDLNKIKGEEFDAKTNSTLEGQWLK